MAIQICVPKEVREDEQRVALVPDIVDRLTKIGLSINIEAGAGALVGYTDNDFANANIITDSEKLLGSADITLMVNPPTEEQISQLREGSILIGYLNPFSNLERFNQLKARKISSFSVEISNVCSAFHTGSFPPFAWGFVAKTWLPSVSLA